jgi:Holliday junction resolvase RusA-like endonuclease
VRRSELPGDPTGPRHRTPRRDDREALPLQSLRLASGDPGAAREATPEAGQETREDRSRWVIERLLDRPPLYWFSVAGDPVSKQRPRLGRSGVYTPQKTQQAEDWIAWSFVDQCGRPSPDRESHFALEAHFYATRWVRDADNLLKTIMDGLQAGKTDTGPYGNDAQVSVIFTSKHQVKRHRRIRLIEPHTVVGLWKITDPEEEALSA